VRACCTRRCRWRRGGDRSGQGRQSRLAQFRQGRILAAHGPGEVAEQLGLSRQTVTSGCAAGAPWVGPGGPIARRGRTTCLARPPPGDQLLGLQEEVDHRDEIRGSGLLVRSRMSASRGRVRAPSSVILGAPQERPRLCGRALLPCSVRALLRAVVDGRLRDGWEWGGWRSAQRRSPRGRSPCRPVTIAR
jgi:hypothetical protein